MKISIIIPAYNAEKYIENCINSILNQDFDDYEIILVNDGSTDKTAKLCEKFISNNHFVYIEQENQGQGSARNRGIDAAAGEWLVFLDADDDMNPGALKCISDEIDRKNGTDIICYEFTLYAEDEISDITIEEKDITDKHDLIRNVSTFLWDKAIRRDFYTSIDVQQCNLYGEDLIVVYLLLALSENYSIINKALVNHYDREDNLSSRVEKVAEFPESIKELIRVFKERGLFERYRDDLFFVTEKQIALYTDIISDRIGLKASEKICRSLDKILEQNYFDHPDRLYGYGMDLITIGSDFHKISSEMSFWNKIHFESMNNFMIFDRCAQCRRQVYFINLDHEYMEADTGARSKEWLKNRWREKVREFSKKAHEIGVPYNIYVFNNRDDGLLDHTILSEIAPTYECEKTERFQLENNKNAILKERIDTEPDGESTFWNHGEQYRMWINENALLMLFRIRNEEKSIPKYFEKNNIKNIYIYGAGYLGTLFFDECVRQNFTPIGFIEKNAGYYKEVKIYGIDDELPEEGTIVVAVPHLYEKIKEDLADSSKRNTISILTLFENIVKGA